MSIAISNDAGRIVYLLQPEYDQVTRVTEAILLDEIAPAELPAYGSNRWTANNADWILSRWLPGSWMHPRTGKAGLNVARAIHDRNPHALRILVESYLACVQVTPFVTLAYEVACCNGSSIVSDEIMPCGVWAKDPAANAHDYLFDLHHANVPDTTGYCWTFDQANDAYCDIYAAAGFPMIARTRRLGLALFGGRVWRGGRSVTGLARSRS